MDKDETALAIIAGLIEPFAHFETFYTKPRPERKDGEGMISWRDRVGGEVRWAAVHYIAARLRGKAT